MLAVGVMRAAAWPNLLAIPPHCPVCVCVCVCDISAPSGKSVRQASCCVAELEGWLRGSVCCKEACITVTIIIMVLW